MRLIAIQLLFFVYPDVSNFNGFAVETWMAFLSEDGLMASNSIYTGELMVQ